MAKDDQKKKKIEEIKEIKKEEIEAEEEQQIPRARFEFEAGERVAPVLKPREAPEEKERLEEMLAGIEAPEKEEKKEIGKYERISRGAEYLPQRREEEGVKYVELKRVMPRQETIRAPALHHDIAPEMRMMERPETKYDMGKDEHELPFREHERSRRKYKAQMM